MTVPTYRPLGFGEILDGAFTLYRRNLVTFLVTALLPTLALMWLMARYAGGVFVALLSEDPTRILGALGTMVVAGTAGGVIYLVMWAALTRETAQAYLMQPRSVADGFRTALRKLPTLLGSAIVIGIALAVLFFALSIVLGVIAAIMGAGAGGSASTVLSGLLGLMMFAVYLVVVATLFAVLPAVIVEDKGPVEAIARSFDLARGALPRLVGLILVTIIIVYLPGFAVTALTGGFADMGNPEAVPSTGQFVTQQLLGLGVSVLTTPFMAAVVSLAYFDRRMRTEALDVQLAAERLAPAS
jgi:hypothetical protein